MENLLYIVTLDLIDPGGIETQIFVFKNEIDQELCYREAFTRLKIGNKEKSLSWFTINLDNIEYGVKYFKIQ